MPTYQEILAEAEEFIDNKFFKFTGQKVDQSNDYFKMLEEACVQETTTETLEFLVAVQNKTAPKVLFKKYIKVGADRELNISGPDREGYTRLMRELIAGKIDNKTYFTYILKGGTYQFEGEALGTSLGALFKRMARLLRKSRKTFFENLKAKYDVQQVDKSKVSNTPFYKHLIKSGVMKAFAKDMKDIKSGSKSPSNPKAFKTIKSMAENMGSFNKIDSIDDIENIAAYLDKKPAIDKYLKTCGCKSWKDTLKKNDKYLHVFYAVRELDKILDTVGV